MNLEEQERELEKIISIIKETMFKKGNDYANTDRLSNFKLAGSIVGLSAEQNCLSLIATKVARLGVLLKGEKPNNESIEDSILDMVCYSCLLSMLHEEVSPKENFEINKDF
tara:strand:+ start:455 stop:787 length:333 start_codon:yes stop_codon:yes gene_type:complete